MENYRALSGLKVLDLSRVLAGPFCGMVLADLGAEVVKVEVPDTGDDSRAFGPFIGSESAYFMSLNRNKESVSLNLKSQEGRGIFLKLVEHFDVVLENYRPGTMEKLGLDYEVLAGVNPRIIYAACSGFGHTGPYSRKPAYDIVVQGMGGIMSITGHPGGPPTRVGASVGDITAALFTTVGILAAVNYRYKTGKGQKVDVAMFDSQVAILENAIARYEVTGQVPQRIGNRHPSISPFSSVQAADGFLIVAVGNDSLWGKFCQLVEREDLIDNPLYTTNQNRTTNWSTLEPILNEVFIKRTVDEWINMLESAGVPCGPINPVDKVVSDPHILSRKMIVEIEHPVAGKLKMAACPIKMSENQGDDVRKPAPILGQHTNDVLSHYLGIKEEEIKELRAKGVV